MRCTGPRTEVNNELLGITNIESKIVVLAPSIRLSIFLPWSWLIVTRYLSNNSGIFIKFMDDIGTVSGYIVICIERVEQGTDHTALRCPCVDGL